MPSLRQLIAQSSPLLVLDAASERIQVGLLGPDSDRWCTAASDAGRGLFRALDELGVDPSPIQAFVYCDGPGSILGIRATAMVLRTWNVLRHRPVYSYHSLAVVAAAQADPSLTFIADARRDRWHCLRTGHELTRVGTSELSGRLAMPDGFATWSQLPPEVERATYDLSQLFAADAVRDTDLLREAPEPDAFLHEPPQYVTWSPEIHRAPANPS